MTNDHIKSGGELKACHWCGSSPYSVPQTCQYSGPGVVHRYRILCPSCKTQTGECITPEAAIKSWQAGYAYVPLAAARTPAKAGEDGVQIDIGELAAAIRVNLYRHVPNMPSYPVGIVEKVLKAALHGDQEG